MKTDFLTPKQQLFCDEYLTDFNATRAALRAGYSASTALNGQLMNMPKIRLYLQQRTEATAKKVQVSGDAVIAELCKIAFGNFGNYYLPNGGLKPMQDLTADEKAALWYVKTGADGAVSVKMYNKMAALEKLAKHLGLFNPEIEEPEKEYVYLDDDDLAEDDAFDEVDEPDDEADDYGVPDDFEFLERDGTPMFDGGLPYGQMANVFRFDINDTTPVSFAKLNCYERIQAAAPEGSGLSVADFDVRKRVADWMNNHLCKNHRRYPRKGYHDNLLLFLFEDMRNAKRDLMGCYEEVVG